MPCMGVDSKKKIIYQISKKMFGQGPNSGSFIEVTEPLFHPHLTESIVLISKTALFNFHHYMYLNIHPECYTVN